MIFYMSIANQIINSVNNNDNIGADDIINSPSNVDYNVQPIQNSNPVNIVSPVVSPSEVKQPELYKPESMSYFSIILYSLLCILLVILTLIYYTKVNVFEYLGNMVDEIYNFFYPVINFFHYLIYGTFIQTTDSTVKGSEKVVDIVTNQYEEDKEKIEKEENNKINIQHNLKNDINKSNKKESHVNTDEVDSEIQKKSNWCYIGEDQGVRKCVRMEDQVCLSNDIYPNYNNCVFPR